MQGWAGKLCNVGWGVTRHTAARQFTHSPTSSPTFTLLLSSPHHTTPSGTVLSSPARLTHTAQTHFAVRSSRTLSTQACSSQASLSLSAPHRHGHATQLAPHKPHFHTAQHQTDTPPTQLPLSSTVHASPNSPIPARLLQSPQTSS
jgi:hypothetical protein